VGVDANGVPWAPTHPMPVTGGTIDANSLAVLGQIATALRNADHKADPNHPLQVFRVGDPNFPMSDGNQPAVSRVGLAPANCVGVLLLPDPNAGVTVYASLKMTADPNLLWPIPAGGIYKSCDANWANSLYLQPAGVIVTRIVDVPRS
jgi:hypothetical protein